MRSESVPRKSVCFAGEEFFFSLTAGGPQRAEVKLSNEKGFGEWEGKVAVRKESSMKMISSSAALL
jgi:hypothetical protein